MFDAGTGPLITTLVGVIGDAIDPSAVDVGVGATVGDGSSPHADKSAADTRLSNPARATRRLISCKLTRTLKVGTNVFEFLICLG